MGSYYRLIRAEVEISYREIPLLPPLSFKYNLGPQDHQGRDGVGSGGGVDDVSPNSPHISDLGRAHAIGSPSQDRCSFFDQRRRGELAMGDEGPNANLVPFFRDELQFRNAADIHQ